MDLAAKSSAKTTVSINISVESLLKKFQANPNFMEDHNNADLLSFVSVFVATKKYDFKFVEQLINNFIPRMEDVDVPVLVSIINNLASLFHRNSAFLIQWRVAALNKISLFSPEDIINSIKSMSVLEPNRELSSMGRSALEDYGGFVRIFIAKLNTVDISLSPTQLNDLMFSLSKLEFYDEEIVTKWCQSIPVLISKLNTYVLWQCFHVMNKLEIHDVSLIEALINRSQDLLRYANSPSKYKINIAFELASILVISDQLSDKTSALKAHVIELLNRIDSSSVVMTSDKRQILFIIDNLKLTHQLDQKKFSQSLIQTWGSEVAGNFYNEVTISNTQQEIFDWLSKWLSNNKLFEVKEEILERRSLGPIDIMVKFKSTKLLIQVDGISSHHRLDDLTAYNIKTKINTKLLTQDTDQDIILLRVNCDDNYKHIIGEKVKETFPRALASAKMLAQIDVAARVQTTLAAPLPLLSASSSAKPKSKKEPSAFKVSAVKESEDLDELIASALQDDATKQAASRVTTSRHAVQLGLIITKGKALVDSLKSKDLIKIKEATFQYKTELNRLDKLSIASLLKKVYEILYTQIDAEKSILQTIKNELRQAADYAATQTGALQEMANLEFLTKKLKLLNPNSDQNYKKQAAICAILLDEEGLISFTPKEQIHALSQDIINLAIASRNNNILVSFFERLKKQFISLDIPTMQNFLFVAIDHANFAAFKFISDQEPSLNINYIYPNGFSLLDAACIALDFDAVDFILNVKGGNPNIIGITETPPLLIVMDALDIYIGNSKIYLLVQEITNLLLQAGANSNAYYGLSRQNVIFKALKHGFKNIVEDILIKHELDISKPLEEGDIKTIPFIIAVDFKQYDIAKLIFRYSDNQEESLSLLKRHIQYSHIQESQSFVQELEQSLLRVQDDRSALYIFDVGDGLIYYNPLKNKVALYSKHDSAEIYMDFNTYTQFLRLTKEEYEKVKLIKSALDRAEDQQLDKPTVSNPLKDTISLLYSGAIIGTQIMESERAIKYFSNEILKFNISFPDVSKSIKIGSYFAFSATAAMFLPNKAHNAQQILGMPAINTVYYAISLFSHDYVKSYPIISSAIVISIQISQGTSPYKILNTAANIIIDLSAAYFNNNHEKSKFEKIIPYMADIAIGFLTPQTSLATTAVGVSANLLATISLISVNHIACKNALSIVCNSETIDCYNLPLIGDLFEKYGADLS